MHKNYSNNKKKFEYTKYEQNFENCCLGETIQKYLFVLNNLLCNLCFMFNQLIKSIIAKAILFSIIFINIKHDVVSFL